MAKKPMTQEELLALPAMIHFRQACNALNIDPTKGYQWAREGTFPVPVRKIGAHYRVPTAPILRFLGIERDHTHDTHASTLNGEASFSPAVRRSLDFSPAVYVKTKSGKRIKIDPDKMYRRGGRRVLGADIIAERQA
ncbi:hypothetical protein L1857_34620 [Amycolatopsis thermalba]|uniref:Helix-turn-helix domain-containing protein n=1 Tax=Amycolatopsis thermalba TaxID=944492 RepID=A0ABY4P5K0_9PSEU|nr:MULTISPECIES: hypothetical protein [Amycolatopsis]UQS27569.1 hypothetical protein L1857_34620 [Amycolatopsis thermalba]